MYLLVGLRLAGMLCWGEQLVYCLLLQFYHKEG